MREENKLERNKREELTLFKIMDPRVLNELLKRRGNKRHNFKVWKAFMEDYNSIVTEASNFKF